MNLNFPQEFILFDLEWTSWESSKEHNWGGPNEHREVIQIGALRVSRSLEELDSFCVFVKPVKNPRLSDFIVELTGITQEKVDTEGKTFKEALQLFKEFSQDLPLYAYGKDAEVLEENCQLTETPPLLAGNKSTSLREPLKPLLAERGIDSSKYTSGTLLEAFGKKGARAHDAVNDMRNLLVVLRELK